MALVAKDFDLYYNGFTIVFDNGEQLLERPLIPYESKQPDLYHTVKQGDTITGIAWKYYKDFTNDSTKYWKYIADVNNIQNPLDLTEYLGKNLLIPNFQLIKLVE